MSTGGIVQNWAQASNITLTKNQYNQLAAYQALVLETNKSLNLTAITHPEDFAVKHFIDSLTLLPLLPTGAFSLLDIGTGAGFPGIVLKIARPDIELTLLDSLRKRIFFLQNTLTKLNLNGTTLHARAEDLPRLFPATKYDLCTARAVAKLDKLCKYALPLLKPGGTFLAMKGPNSQQEATEAQPAITKYGGKIQHIQTTEIAPGLKHSVVIIRTPVPAPEELQR